MTVKDASPSPSPDDRGSMALVGVTVVDVIGEKHDPGQTVLVESGRITAVGPVADVPIPSTARHQDLRGRWIVPGLIDMHCHLTAPPLDDVPLELLLVNGVTTVRDPGGRVAAQRLLRESVQAGQRLGPRILIAGEFLDGNPPVWPHASHLVDTPERGAAAVRHLAAQGVDCVKVYNHVSEDVLATVVAASREAGLPVIGHVPRRMSMLRAIEAGMNGLEHIRITGRDFLPQQQAEQLDMLPVGEREPRIWQLIDLESPWIQAIIDAMITHDVTLDPTLLIEDVVHGEGIQKQIDHPDNAYLPAQTRQSWAARVVPSIMQMPDELHAMGPSTNAKRHEFVRRCWQAGVRITSGTDGVDFGRLLPGFGVHHEIELLRQAGLPSFAALRAATINAAQALQMADQLGSIEVGKIADIGVWTADPLRKHLRPEDLDTVLIGGVAHSRKDLLGR